MDNQGTFNYKVVRQFAVMTVVWGVVGMLVGVIIAAELLWPDLVQGIPWLSYGRLRPLHTNAVIFAFGGCALFATSYYCAQRTCQGRGQLGYGPTNSRLDAGKLGLSLSLQFFQNQFSHHGL